MSDPVIAVTGASGRVGGRVAELLAERGARQRLVVRAAERAPRLGFADVHVAAGGYANGPEMEWVLHGADTLLLVPAAEAPDRAHQHRTVVDAAVVAGIERIVYVSFLGAAPDATFTLARDHWETEERIRATGLPFCFLRMSLYLDFLPAMVGPDGVIRGPAGRGRVGAVLREDVAACAAAVLLDDGAHDGETIDLTGPEALTLAEAAEIMTRHGGAPIRFEDETEEEAHASRARWGAPDWGVRGWVTSYLAIRDGSLAAVTDGVRRLTGREPGSLDAWLAGHPEALAHVTSG